MSYRKAIQWIALNDENGAPERLDPTFNGDLVTACMVRDVYGKDAHEVGWAIVRERQRNDRAEKRARKLAAKPAVCGEG